MKKDKKFLLELESNLVGIKQKYKDEIISKYDNIIKEEKKNKKRIKEIIKDLGDPEEIAKKEMDLLGNKSKESFFDRLKNKIEARKLKKEKDSKEKVSFKEKVNNFKNKVSSKKDNDINSDKVSLKEKFNNYKSKLKEKREEKKRIKEEKKKIKEEQKKVNEILKESIQEDNETTDNKSNNGFFGKVKGFLTKEIHFKKKRKVTDEPKEIIEEIKEEIQEEVSEVSEIIPEKKIFENRKTRIKRIVLKILGVIITVLLLFIWLWLTVIFIASLFAYLDGVKFIGINIALFGLELLVLWIVIMINRAIFRKRMSVRLNLIICSISIVIIAFGIVYGFKQISSIKTVKDVSDKYSMTTKLSNYTLPENKNFTITFNSNYNTQYTVNYDDTIKDKVKLEVKYYECYYDYYVKETSKSAYVSLKLDSRDRLSVYIDDLKEGKIYDNDELSRYSVVITINPNDVSRLVILD